MFNRKPPDVNIIMPTQTELVTQFVTREVHEHRAPTDASVALLKEMETAARNKIVESIKVTGNSFEAVVHMELDFASGDKVAVAIFTLNGTKLKAEARVPTNDPKANDELYVRLVKSVSDKIAEQIMYSFARALGGRT